VALIFGQRYGYDLSVCRMAISGFFEALDVDFSALWNAVRVRMSRRFLGLEIAICIIS
jgi:hypothetical protein